MGSYGVAHIIFRYKINGLIKGVIIPFKFVEHMSSLIRSIISKVPNYWKCLQVLLIEYGRRPIKVLSAVYQHEYNETLIKYVIFACDFLSMKNQIWEKNNIIYIQGMLNPLLTTSHRKPTFLYQYLLHPMENHNRYLKVRNMRILNFFTVHCYEI